MAELDPDVIALLEAYLDALGGRSGQMVLADLRSNFSDLRNSALVEELAEIPHPFRAYVEKGLRMAVDKIEGVIVYAEQVRAAGYTATTEDDDDNPIESI